MKTAYLYSFFMGLFSVFVSAQAVIPKMKISRETNANPMVLQELDMNIYVVGQIAVTTMEMVFYNPNDRVMEGEFEFPLAHGQQVSRFALDIEGKLREGVVVDKTKGRNAFESIVRRGVDPGLLEKTEGNNFKARVYPMPSKGTRRILIAFEQELSQKNGQDFYFLPIKNDIKLQKFKLKAEVVSRFVKSEDRNSLLDFKNWRNSYISEVSKTDFVISQDIKLVFPNVEKPQILTASQNNKTYFYGNFPLQKQEIQSKVFPKKIGILWDASSSSKNRNFKEEFALLDLYFQKIKNAKIEVSTFHIDMSKSVEFSVKNGDWQELKSFLEKTFYDGATDANAMIFNQKNDEFLLFTDGIFNFGKESVLLDKKLKSPVYVINSNKVANTDKSKAFALSTGGNFIDLTTHSAENSLEKLLENPYRLLGIEVKSGKIAQIFPSEKSVVSKNNHSFSGELLSETATLVFSFGYKDKVLERKEVTITQNTSATEQEFALSRRVFGQNKITQMRMEAKVQSEIDAVGREFGIVTEGNSLIVLETLRDYVNYEIVPPVELQEAYFEEIILRDEAIKKQKEIKEVQRERNLEFLIRLSEEQTKWWNTNFLPRIKKVEPSSENIVIRGIPSERSTRQVSERNSERNSERRARQRARERSTEMRVRQVPEIEVQEDVAVVLGATETAKEVVTIGQGTQPRAKYIGAVQGNQATEKSQIGIELNGWNPDTPYAKVLQYTDKEKAYETYLKLKEEYGQTPSFYVDAADYFFKNGQSEIAVRVISNLAELNLEEAQLLRVLGYKLSEYQCFGQAVWVFERVLKIRAEEPQSYRDLGLALAQNGQYNEAVKNLYKVVTETWNNRFVGIQLIAMNEINAIVNTQKDVDTSFINKKLLKKEPVDIRVVLTWDTDNSDMDLWVTDPKKEICSYKNKLTRIGGKISDDVMGGYGPEEFMIKKAIKGEYKIQVEYYGNRSQKQLFPVSLRLEFFTNYGTPNQKKQEVIVRLSESKSVIDVGKFLY